MSWVFLIVISLKLHEKSTLKDFLLFNFLTSRVRIRCFPKWTNLGSFLVGMGLKHTHGVIKSFKS